MQTSQRTYRRRVIDGLLEQPERFEFFQAVRLWSLYLSAGEEHGSSARLVGDRIRFRNSLELSFAPSVIESMQVLANPPEEPGPAPTRPTYRKITLTVPFMGLTGATGVLPRHYTEALAERESLFRDRAARAFLDLFSSRMVGFFYGAWQKYRLPLQHEIKAEYGYQLMLLNLAGYRHGLDEGSDHSAAQYLPDEAFAAYSGVLRQQQVSAENLRRVIADYFQVGAEVEQFIGRWFVIPDEQVTRLSGAYSELGKSTFCGERVWQRDQRVKVTIGPLTADQNTAFLPGGYSMKALAELLKYWCGPTVEFEVELILKRNEAKQAALTSEGTGSRLGCDAFLTTQTFIADVQHARYEL